MAGTIERDPRYHPAFQRGYTGPPLERRAREEERFRRPRGASRAEAASPPDRVPSRPAKTPAPALEPLDPAVALGFDAPKEGETDLRAESRGEERRDESPLPAILDPAVSRRVARTLALSGVVLVAVGLLALWRSSQSWFDYAPSQDTFGPEQYLRALCDLVAVPSLTVGFIALCSAVLVPLVRATRR